MAPQTLAGAVSLATRPQNTALAKSPCCDDTSQGSIDVAGPVAVARCTYPKGCSPDAR
jgi:hypothetical protein